MRLLLFIFFTSFSLPLSAQTPKKKNKVIDIFDNQEKLGSTGLKIENSESSAEYAVSGGPGFDLKFKRGAAGILVPAKINGKSVYFLFDTGASITTLTPKGARLARVTPGKDAPRAIIETANGTTQTRFGILDNLSLGGRNHFRVAFSLCKGCPGGKYQGKPIVGLLGMNLIGRYRTSIDDEKGIVSMTPLRNFNNRIRDIQIFLNIHPISGEQHRRKAKIKLVLQNLGKNSVKNIRFQLRCADGKQKQKKVKRLNAKKTRKTSLIIDSPRCGEPEIVLEHAEWAL